MTNSYRVHDKTLWQVRLVYDRTSLIQKTMCFYCEYRRTVFNLPIARSHRHTNDNKTRGKDFQNQVDHFEVTFQQSEFGFQQIQKGQSGIVSCYQRKESVNIITYQLHSAYVLNCITMQYRNCQDIRIEVDQQNSMRHAF